MMCASGASGVVAFLFMYQLLFSVRPFESLPANSLFFLLIFQVFHSGNHKCAKAFRYDNQDDSPLPVNTVRLSLVPFFSSFVRRGLKLLSFPSS